jgi:hypothetical protein
MIDDIRLNKEHFLVISNQFRVVWREQMMSLRHYLMERNYQR